MTSRRLASGPASATAAFAITFRQKDSYIDLTGKANIRWYVKTSGFHVVRPVVKLPDGTLLVADLSFASIPLLTENQFSLMGLHWLKLDPDRIVTLGHNPTPNNETWVPDPDLSKVDEVGVRGPDAQQQPRDRRLHPARPNRSLWQTFRATPSQQ